MKRRSIRPSSPPRVKLNASGKPRERFEGLRLEDFRTWIRGRKCLLHGPRCRYENHQSDACHVESKARGSGDASNLLSLCRLHHREQHDYGTKSFECEYADALGGKNLRTLAGETWLKYEAERGVAL